MRAAETNLPPSVLRLAPPSTHVSQVPACPPDPVPHSATPCIITLLFLCCWEISSLLEPSLPSCFTCRSADSRVALQRQPCPASPSATCPVLLPGLHSFPWPVPWPWALAPVPELPLVSLVLRGLLATCLLSHVLLQEATIQTLPLPHGGPRAISVHSRRGLYTPLCSECPWEDMGGSRLPCPASLRSLMPGTLSTLPLPPETWGPSLSFFAVGDSAEQGHMDKALNPQ